MYIFMSVHRRKEKIHLTIIDTKEKEYNNT